MKPQHYEIRVEGDLGPSWSDWFEGLAVGYEADVEGKSVQTILSGVMDQAMLHGVLMRICNLGLPLVSVCRVEAINRVDGDKNIGS